MRKIKYEEICDESPLAYQLLVGKKLIWLPKSQVIIYKVACEVEIPEWLYLRNFGGKK